MTAGPANNAHLVDGDPAREDYIGHGFWQTTLMHFVYRLWDTKDRPAAGSFAILLEGPWGSGKSSILALVKDGLTRRMANAPEPPIVVDFNAWLHQRSGHLWYALIQQTISAAVGQAGGSWWQRKLAVRRLKQWWEPKSTIARVHSLLTWTLGLGVLFLISIVLWILFWDIASLDYPEINDTGKVIGTFLETIANFTGATGPLIKAISTIFVVILGGLGGWRYLQLHQPLKQTAAEEFLAGKPNALEEAKEYFCERLAATIKRPILVMVDDLDRCDPETVVDCLNALQTVLRGPRIVHLVAANRYWLRSCYDLHFRGLVNADQEPGRSLGDLFLDKIFQLSVPVPRIGAERITHFAHQARAGEASARTLDLKDDAGPIPGLTDELLLEAAPLLRFNPRLMGRFSNEMEFGLQLRKLLDRDRLAGPTDVRVLGGWTLLRLRWPALAEYLEEHPEALAWLPVHKMDQAAAGLPPEYPERLRAIFVSRQYGDFCSSVFMPQDPCVFADYWVIE